MKYQRLTQANSKVPKKLKYQSCNQLLYISESVHSSPWKYCIFANEAYKFSPKKYIHFYRRNIFIFTKKNILILAKKHIFYFNLMCPTPSLLSFWVKYKLCLGYARCEVYVSVALFLLSAGLNTFTVPGCKSTMLDIAPAYSG